MSTPHSVHSLSITYTLWGSGVEACDSGHTLTPGTVAIRITRRALLTLLVPKWCPLSFPQPDSFHPPFCSSENQLVTQRRLPSFSIADAFSLGGKIFKWVLYRSDMHTPPTFYNPSYGTWTQICQAQTFAPFSRCFYLVTVLGSWAYSRLEDRTEDEGSGEMNDPL